MSNAILERTRDFLVATGLIDSYQHRFHRWIDADIEQNTPVVVFRKTGDGPSDVFKQESDVTITILEDSPTKVQALGVTVQDIVRKFRSSDTIAGVIKFELLSSQQGPFYLENERPLYQINVRVFTEDQ